MLTIVRKTIQGKLRSLLATAGICVLMVWMFISMFPSIQQEADKMTEMLAAFPDSMIQIFGIEGGNLFSSLEPFMTIEYYSLIWPLVLVILVITVSVSAVSGEMEDGTMDLLLARPVSRAKLFFAKYAGGSVVILLFIILSVLSVYPLGWLYGVEVAGEAHWTIALLGLLFGMAVYSVDMFISSALSTKGAATSIMAGWIFLMYVAEIFASLYEKMEWLQYVSFFHYFDYREALLHNTISAESLVIFGVTIVAGFAAGLVWFRRRDILS
jgi:ABC-2 type transport system permease protein